MHQLDHDTTITYYVDTVDSYRSYFNQAPSFSNLNIINNKYDTVVSLTASDIESKQESFLAAINNSTLDSSLLIPGLRFSIPGLIVFERPPTKKLIQYINNTVDEMSNDCDCDDCSDNYIEPEDLTIERHLIPVPWQVYVVTYSLNPSSKYQVTSVRMYFSNTSLNSSDVTLYAPYIHNFFMNGSLCNPMFDSYDEISRYPLNIQGVIASSYDWIWNTGFIRKDHD